MLEGPFSKRIEQLKEVAVRMGKKVIMDEEKKSQATLTQSSLWNKLMIFMTSPADPSNLAVLRILFGKVVAVYFFLCVLSQRSFKSGHVRGVDHSSTGADLL